MQPAPAFSRRQLKLKGTYSRTKNDFRAAYLSRTPSPSLSTVEGEGFQGAHDEAAPEFPIYVSITSRHPHPRPSRTTTRFPARPVELLHERDVIFGPLDHRDDVRVPQGLLLGVVGVGRRLVDARLVPVAPVLVALHVYVDLRAGRRHDNNAREAAPVRLALFGVEALVFQRLDGVPLKSIGHLLKTLLLLHVI